MSTVSITLLLFSTDRVNEAAIALGANEEGGKVCEDAKFDDCKSTFDREVAAAGTNVTQNCTASEKLNTCLDNEVEGCAESYNLTKYMMLKKENKEFMKTNNCTQGQTMCQMKLSDCKDTILIARNCSTKTESIKCYLDVYITCANTEAAIDIDKLMNLTAYGSSCGNDGKCHLDYYNCATSKANISCAAGMEAKECCSTTEDLLDCAMKNNDCKETLGYSVIKKAFEAKCGAMGLTSTWILMIVAAVLIKFV